MSHKHTQEDYPLSTGDGVNASTIEGGNDHTSKVIQAKACSSRQQSNNNEQSIYSLKDHGQTGYHQQPIDNKLISQQVPVNKFQNKIESSGPPNQNIIHFHSHQHQAAAPTQSFMMPRSPQQTIMTSGALLAQQQQSRISYGNQVQAPNLQLSQSQSQSDLSVVGGTFKSQNKLAKPAAATHHQHLNSANPKRYSHLTSAGVGNLNLHIIVHEVTIQIPSSINLIVACMHNEEKFETPQKRRVDNNTKIADFQDQELVIPIVKTPTEGDGNQPALRESQAFGIKLMAVNENKQKLIGLYQLKVHLRTFEVVERKRFTFDKCIDKNGQITITACLRPPPSPLTPIIGRFEDQNVSNGQSIIQRGFQDPRPVTSISNKILTSFQQSMDQARLHAQLREDNLIPVIEPSSSAGNLVNTEEDESNLINKDDFEEGKTKAIVTSRETPIKANAMARKNMSTTRKHGDYAQSPALRGAVDYKDPNNPTHLYYQLVNNNNNNSLPSSRMMSHTFRKGNNTVNDGDNINPAQRTILQQLLLYKPEVADQMATERRNQNAVDENANLQQIKGIYNEAQQSASAACSRSSGLVYLRQTPVRQTRRAEIKLINKPPLQQQQQQQLPQSQATSFQQICNQLTSQFKITSLNFMNDLTNNQSNNSRPSQQSAPHHSQQLSNYYKSQQEPSNNNIFSDEIIIKRLQEDVDQLRREKQFLLEVQSKSQSEMESRIIEEQNRYNVLNQEKSKFEQELDLLRAQGTIEKSSLKLYQSNETQLLADIQSYQTQLQELQMKHNRQLQISQLFESRYHSSQTELEAYRTQSQEHQSLVESKEQELEKLRQDTSSTLNTLNFQHDSEKSEWNKKRREMQAELDFRNSELIQRDLELSELRDRIKKKEEECNQLKLNAQGLTQRVDQQYKDEIQVLKIASSKMNGDLLEMQSVVQKENKMRIEAEEKKKDIEERYERQREMMKNSAKELIETQTQVVEIEEKLMITERQLISVKSSWAQAEHEREQMQNKVYEQMERVQELEEKLVKQKNKGRSEGSGPDSIITTKTSSTN